MEHNIIVEGLCFRLRPVVVQDAELILEIRLKDMERNKYIHKITPDIEKQKEWIQSYNKTEGDYYFVIENRITEKPEGLIGIYNIENGAGEWGRWVIKPASFAASESVSLIYKTAFEKLKLTELYCCTLEENKTVVAFHDGIGEQRRGILKNHSMLEGVSYDAVEHFSTLENFKQNIEPILQEKSIKIFNRTLKSVLGKFEFHHIGVATKSIGKEILSFQLLGYQRENVVFEDAIQGIRGQFLVCKGQPRIELLENLENSTTLNKFLESKIKLYHFAYMVKDFDAAMNVFSRLRTRVISSPQVSVYFKKRISFLMLQNMFLIELIEE